MSTRVAAPALLIDPGEAALVWSLMKDELATRLGVSARLVFVSSGEVLWTGSDVASVFSFEESARSVAELFRYETLDAYRDARPDA